MNDLMGLILSISISCSISTILGALTSRTQLGTRGIGNGSIVLVVLGLCIAMLITVGYNTWCPIFHRDYNGPPIS